MWVAVLAMAVAIAAGAMLAQVGLLDAHGNRALALVAFYVGSPALLLTVLQGADVGSVLSVGLLASGVGVLVCCILACLVADRSEGLGGAVVPAMCASYVNASNLGLPVATYVLGNAVAIVPQALLQLLVIQPAALAILGTATGSRRHWSLSLVASFANPVTISSALGLALAMTHAGVPAVLNQPLDMLAGLAVPAMLISFGASLRLGPVPGRGARPLRLGAVVAVKLLVQPIATYLAGAYVFHVGHAALLAATLVAGLPTAQNVFVLALRYRRESVLARDAIFFSTVGFIPVLAVVALLR